MALKKRVTQAPKPKAPAEIDWDEKKDQESLEAWVARKNEEEGLDGATGHQVNEHRMPQKWEESERFDTHMGVN